MVSNYRPLESARGDIRLLKLHSTLFRESDIRCSLLHTSLNERPSYTALSYVWGDAGDRARIWLDGHEFLVTRNLFGALKQLRPIFLDTVLWVDAICINQSDVAERNAQVPRMRDIYAAAKMTVVWLGLKSATVEKAFRYFEDLWNIASRYSSQSDYPGVCFQKRPDLIDRDSCDTIISFFSQEWWKRVWTYQECVLSNEIEFFCGDKSLDWYTLDEAWQPLRLVGNDLNFDTRWMNWGSVHGLDFEVDQLQTLGGAFFGSGRGVEMLDEEQVLRVRELMEVAPHLHFYQRGLKFFMVMLQIAGMYKSDFQPLLTGFMRFVKLATWLQKPPIEEPFNIDDWDMPDRFKRFHQWMRHEAPFDSVYRKKKESYIDMIIESQVIGIERLVLYGLERKCADPRDKIYGLLGAGTAKYVELSVDYSRPVFEVYADLVRSIALQKGELRLLTVAGLAKRDETDLPSWVPDFSQSKELLRFDKMRYDSDFVDRMPPAAASFSADLKTMTTPAIIVTTVSTLGDVLSVESYDDFSWDFFAAVENFLESNYHPLVCALPWRQVLFRTLIADDTDLIFPDSDELRLFRTRATGFVGLMAVMAAIKKAGIPEKQIKMAEKGKGNSDLYLLNCFAWWMDPTPDTKATREIFTQEFLGLDTWASSHWDFSREQGPENQVSTLLGLMSKIRSTCRGNRLFSTQDGYVGIAPSSIKRGDIIVAVPGSYVLLILRRKGLVYELMSDCYICGRSAGGVWQEHVNGTRQIQEIILV